MNTYVVLLRGINVGGKNKLPMTDLKMLLEELGFSRVTTYIASGNVIVDSAKSAKEIESIIEKALPKKFVLDSELIKVLALSSRQLQQVITDKPSGFGDLPEKYHSDVIFLMGLDSAEVIGLFKPKEGVDMIWPGNGVIYSQRLSTLRTKSRLSAIMSAKEYKFMSIRTWNTTIKLLELMSV